MRIIAGQAKGRHLLGPKSAFIRPVSDKVKEAVFNILGNIEGAKVADFFAGTGSVGLEAVSRGAKHACFFDQLPEALKILDQNIKKCGFEKNCAVIRGRLPESAGIAAKKGLTFNIAFVDPPYDKDLVNPTLKAIYQNKLIDAGSMVIIEHSPREKITCPDFTITDERKYGQTYITFVEIRAMTPRTT